LEEKVYMQILQIIVKILHGRTPQVFICGQ